MAKKPQQIMAKKPQQMTFFPLVIIVVLTKKSPLNSYLEEVEININFDIYVFEYWQQSATLSPNHSS